MKIYEFLIIDIETGKVLEEVSFEYVGPVILCGSGGSGNPLTDALDPGMFFHGPDKPATPTIPGKTETEKELDTTQLDLLKLQVSGQQRQDAYQKEMEPFILESMGYTRDDAGKIAKRDMSKDPETILRNKQLAMQGYSPIGEKLTEDQIKSAMTASELSDYELNAATKQRQLDAMQGKLAISPALEAELSAEEAQAQEVLSRKLGNNWMISTPGQNAITKIKQKANLVREEARRGAIDTTQGILNSKANQSAMASSLTSGTTQLFSGETGNALQRMQGFINAQSGGRAFDDALSLSSKYASERANQQNLGMQQWVTQMNANSASKSSSNQTGAMAAAAAAAA